MALVITKTGEVFLAKDRIVDGELKPGDTFLNDECQRVLMSQGAIIVSPGLTRAWLAGNLPKEIFGDMEQKIYRCSRCEYPETIHAEWCKFK